MNRNSIFTVNDLNGSDPCLSIRSRNGASTGLTSAKVMRILLGQLLPSSTNSKTNTNNIVFRTLKEKYHEERPTKGSGWIAGHLLNHALGGSKNPANLTILTATGNGASANQVHSGVERKIKTALEATYRYSMNSNHTYIPCIYYEVEVISNDDQKCQKLFDLHRSIPWGFKVTVIPVLLPRNPANPQINLTGKQNKDIDTMVVACPGLSRDNIKAFVRCYECDLEIPNAEDNGRNDLFPSQYGSSASKRKSLAFQPKGSQSRKIGKQHKMQDLPRVANKAKWLKKNQGRSLDSH